MKFHIWTCEGLVQTTPILIHIHMYLGAPRKLFALLAFNINFVPRNFAYKHSFVNHFLSCLIWFLFAIFSCWWQTIYVRLNNIPQLIENYIFIPYLTQHDSDLLSPSILLYAYHFMLRFLVSSILYSFWHICHIRHTHSASLLNEWRWRRLPTTA